MGVDYKVKQIYDMTIRDVTTNEEKWRDICCLSDNSTGMSLIISL